MKPQNLHAHEDRLLDFAYGELPPGEARAVESHLEGCTRCSEALASIRGVRSTMAQLTLEPAPDAGLESLLAYAQQSARNAAAGPAPKRTGWRRWLVPVMGMAAVAGFGVVTLQTSQSVNLAPDLTYAQEAKRELAKAEPVVASTPSPAAPQAAPAEAPAEPSPMADAVAGMTPPPPAPAAKLDTNSLQAKDFGAPSKAKPSRTKRDQDWSNAGSSGGFARETEDSDGWGPPVAERKKKEADRHDAMTQRGAFEKPKPFTVGPSAEVASTPGGSPKAEPPPPPPPAAQAPRDEEVSADDVYGAEAQAPAPSTLRIGGGRTRGSLDPQIEQPAALEEAQPTQLASLDAAKPSESRREKASRAAPAPAAVTPAAAAPTAAPKGMAEREAPSRAELSKLASLANRQGDRAREAILLRQALAAGATGNERLGLLNRLCDAEFALGRRQAGIEACQAVVEEGPNSSAAQVAIRRLAVESDAKAATQGGSRAPAKAAEMPAPASPPPAPTQ